MRFEGRIEHGEQRLYIDGILRLPRDVSSCFGDRVGWGHPGVSAAHTAHLILVSLGEVPDVQRVNRFKREVVASLWYDRSWIMDRPEIEAWLAQDRRAELAA